MFYVFALIADKAKLVLEIVDKLLAIGIYCASLYIFGGNYVFVNPVLLEVVGTKAPREISATIGLAV